MQTQQLLQYLSKRRVQEVGGIILIGTGVFFLLANLMYTPFYDKLTTATDVYTHSSANYSPPAIIAAQMGAMLFLPGFAFLAFGYALIRRHMPRFAPVMFGVIVVEVFAESSLLGLLLMLGGYTLPLPSGIWGLLMANWLHYALGTVGAVIVPLFILAVCYRAKKTLKRSEREHAPAFLPMVYSKAG